MASSCPSQDQQNFECVTIASVDFIKLPLKDILESRIQPVDLFKEINSCPALLSHKHKLGQDQLNLCFLQPPAEPDYRKFDVTLLYTLIRNLCPSLKPTKGWGTQPDDADIQIGDDIERLRLFRNNYYGHASSAAISDFDFAKIWKDLKSVINRVQSTTKCSVDYEDELIKIERAKFTRAQLENCKLLLEAIVILGQQRKNGEEPHIVIKGEDEVVCGCTANFKAEVKKIDLSRWLIKWQKLNGLITEIINTSKEKYTGSTDTQLVIQSVCREDEGKYQAVILQESKGIENRLSSNIICLHVVEDSNWKAMTKTKITTGKEMETETLKTMIKFLLTTMKNPSKMWLASDLIQVLDDTLKTIDECGRSDLLKELITEIREDDEIQLTLSSCGIKMFYALKSITKKYRSTDLKITDGCVCLTFSFATYDSLEKYLNLLRIGDEDLRRDLTDVMLNKTLLEIFHIDSYHVTWSIDKVIVMRGSTVVKEEHFAKPITEMCKTVDEDLANKEQIKGTPDEPNDNTEPLDQSNRDGRSVNQKMESARVSLGDLQMLDNPLPGLQNQAYKNFEIVMKKYDIGFIEKLKNNGVDCLETFCSMTEEQFEKMELNKDQVRKCILVAYDIKNT